MVAMDKSRRVETWMNEVDSLRQNVERKKLIEEKTVKEILNFELENDAMSENIKTLNEQLSVLTQAGFKGRKIIRLHYAQIGILRCFACNFVTTSVTL